jgi:hypothetical protein
MPNACSQPREGRYNIANDRGIYRCPDSVAPTGLGGCLAFRPTGLRPWLLSVAPMGLAVLLTPVEVHSQKVDEDLSVDLTAPPGQIVIVRQGLPRAGFNPDLAPRGGRRSAVH